jgi:hypothetical protein
MNEEPKSIWKKSLSGWRRILTWAGLFAVSAFFAFLVMNAVSVTEASNSTLLLGALVIAAVIMGLILFIRWLCCWRNFRRFLFGVACFVTLIVLVLSEENWRGKSAWENHKREWEAKGEKFKLSEIVPPPVPDEQNFALTPLFKPILEFTHTANGIRWPDTNAYQHLQQLRADLSPEQGRTNKLVLGNLDRGTFTDLEACRDFYRGNTNYPQPEKSDTAAVDILVALGKFDADLAQLHEANAARPYSRFPIKYDEEPSWAILLPHLANVKGISVLVQMRAIARLEAGQTNAAFDDLKLGFRLSDSISKEPILIDHLVRLAGLGITLQGVREGLVRHAWTDSQLAEFEKQMAAVDLLAEYKLAMRGERVLNIEGLDYLRRRGSFSPDEWVSGSGPVRKAISVGLGSFFYQNMLTVSRMHQEFTIPAADEKAHQVFIEVLRREDEAITELKRGRYNPYKIFARMFFPAITKAVLRSAHTQTFVDAARVACALERYRLTNNRLPDTLDALVPRFIDRIPNDVIDGQPPRYRQTGEGGYVVYSIGWNETDDGGTVVLKKGSTPGVDINKGDWVWQLPAKQDATQRTQTEQAEE